MKGLVARPYTATPCYSPAGLPVGSGWDALAASIPPQVSRVAIDGPVVAGWAHLVEGLGEALDKRGFDPEFRGTEAWLLPWRRIDELTSSYELRDDPDFDHLAPGQLSDLLRPALGPGGAAGTPPGRVRRRCRPGAARRAVVRRLAQALRGGGGGGGHWPQPGSAGRGTDGHDQAPLFYRLAAPRPPSRRNLAARRLMDRHAGCKLTCLSRRQPPCVPHWPNLPYAPFALAPRSTRRRGAATGRKRRSARTRAQSTLRSATN